MNIFAPNPDERYAARWRVVDVVCGATALLLLAPVLVAIALAVLASSGRPVLFAQARIGRRGVPFTIWKFRTMRPGDGGRVTAAGDCRITAIGRWLRKLKLDELPQLFNVLKGEMSLIGPRPEVPEFVDPEDLLWRGVLAAKPGITDLASLVFRNEEEVLATSTNPNEFYRETILPAKLCLNLQYIRSRCWRLDLKLLLLTAYHSFFPWTFDRQRIETAFFQGVRTFEPTFIHSVPRTLDR